MRLVVDTSVLVGELLRSSGRVRLGDDRLELYLPERMWDEVRVELPRRIAAFGRRRGLDRARRRGLDRARRRGLDRTIRDHLAAACLDAVEANVLILDAAIYAALEDEARARCPRDPTDWAVVASALALSADIWTNDNDFLGTGVATWTTDTIRWWLERHPAD